jgi:hypothetical protein
VVWEMLNRWCINKVGKLHMLYDSDVGDEDGDKDKELAQPWPDLPSVIKLMILLIFQTGD